MGVASTASLRGARGGVRAGGEGTVGMRPRTWTARVERSEVGATAVAGDAAGGRSRQRSPEEARALAAAEVVRATRLGFGGDFSASSSGPVEAEGPAAGSAGADGDANLDASTDS